MTDDETEKMRAQFPDYDDPGFEPIAGFEDVSHHNDACPTFLDHEHGLYLQADYVDPAKRDDPERPRFALTHVDVDFDGALGDVFQPVLATDDYEEVRRMALFVREHASRIQAEVSEDVRAGVVPTDVEGFPDLHEHVDANEYAGAVMPLEGVAPDEIVALVGKGVGDPAEAACGVGNAAIHKVDRFIREVGFQRAPTSSP